MSFFYILNQGYAPSAPLQQIHNYYPNLWTYYYQNQENQNLQSYSINWEQNDVAQQFYQNSPTLSTITQAKEPSALQKAQNSSTSKRRMEKTLQKEILSAKKNSQSNIINQFYSFFSSRQKSEKVVERCCILMKKSIEQAQRILNFFYMTIRFINVKRGRKYVNASMFFKFFNTEDFSQYISEMKDKIQQLDFLSLAELCQIFRRCAKYFLKNVSIHAILTSKRISMVSKEQHLKKHRKIMRSIFNN